jgi:hypothetical protein
LPRKNAYDLRSGCEAVLLGRVRKVCRSDRGHVGPVSRAHAHDLETRSG